MPSYYKNKFFLIRGKELRIKIINSIIKFLIKKKIIIIRKQLTETKDRKKKVYLQRTYNYTTMIKNKTHILIKLKKKKLFTKKNITKVKKELKIINYYLTNEFHKFQFEDLMFHR